MEGNERLELLDRAASDVDQKDKAKTKKEENIRKWAVNPNNSELKEISPAAILKNIFHLPEISNPTAEVFYTMLALWRNCPRSAEPQVYRYLELAAKHIMKFRGEEFVEFFRRVLDYPRKDMINPSDPDFADLVNKSVAKACGAEVYLPPETYYEFTAHQSNFQKGKAKKKVVP